MNNFSTRGLVPLPGYEQIQARPVEPPRSVAQPYWQNPSYNPYIYPDQHTRKMPGPQYAYPIVQNVDIKIEEDDVIVKSNKDKKIRQKRGSIEGDTIADLVNNVIKEKANLKQARGAFKKMAEILEDQRELAIFDEF